MRPLTQQDLIWLQAADNLAAVEELDILKFGHEQQMALSLILQDLRLIGLNLIPFKSEMAFRDFLATLPSFKGDATKDKEDRRWKVKKRKPGEVPEWKKNLEQGKSEV